MYTYINTFETFLDSVRLVCSPSGPSTMNTLNHRICSTPIFEFSGGFPPNRGDAVYESDVREDEEVERSETDTDSFNIGCDSLSDGINNNDRDR